MMPLYLEYFEAISVISKYICSFFQMQAMIKKTEEMRLQREHLCEDLRQDVLKDDITKKLVQYKDDEMSNFFKQELQKHDAKKKLIEQNIYAQGNILQAFTECNVTYVETRKIVSELLEARKEMISSLVASFYAFDDLLIKAAKGLEFYAKLDSNVEKLFSRVKGVVEVQQEERDAILAKTVTDIQPVPQFTPYVPQLIHAVPFSSTPASTDMTYETENVTEETKADAPQPNNTDETTSRPEGIPAVSSALMESMALNAPLNPMAPMEPIAPKASILQPEFEEEKHVMPAAPMAPSESNAPRMSGVTFSTMNYPSESNFEPNVPYMPVIPTDSKRPALPTVPDLSNTRKSSLTKGQLPTNTTVPSKPTLKDYLDAMKETKASAKDVYAAMNDTRGASMSGQNYSQQSDTQSNVHNAPYSNYGMTGTMPNVNPQYSYQMYQQNQTLPPQYQIPRDLTKPEERAKTVSPVRSVNDQITQQMRESPLSQVAVSHNQQTYSLMQTTPQPLQYSQPFQHQPVGQKGPMPAATQTPTVMAASQAYMGNYMQHYSNQQYMPQPQASTLPAVHPLHSNVPQSSASQPIPNVSSDKPKNTNENKHGQPQIPPGKLDIPQVPTLPAQSTPTASISHSSMIQGFQMTPSNMANQVVNPTQGYANQSLPVQQHPSSNQAYQYPFHYPQMAARFGTQPDNYPAALKSTDFRFPCHSYHTGLDHPISAHSSQTSVSLTNTSSMSYPMGVSSVSASYPKPVSYGQAVQSFPQQGYQYPQTNQSQGQNNPSVSQQKPNDSTGSGYVQNSPSVQPNPGMSMSPLNSKATEQNQQIVPKAMVHQGQSIPKPLQTNPSNMTNQMMNTPQGYATQVLPGQQIPSAGQATQSPQVHNQSVPTTQNHHMIQSTMPPQGTHIQQYSQVPQGAFASNQTQTLKGQKISQEFQTPVIPQGQTVQTPFAQYPQSQQTQLSYTSMAVRPSTLPPSPKTFAPTSMAVRPSTLPPSQNAFAPTSMPSILPQTQNTFGPTSTPSALPPTQNAFAPRSMPPNLPPSQNTFAPTPMPSNLPQTQNTFAPTSMPSALLQSHNSFGPTSMASALPPTQNTFGPTSMPSTLPPSQNTFVPTSLPTQIKMQPVVPQPGSQQIPQPRPMYPYRPSPAPSPFQPISPAPLMSEERMNFRPESIDIERRSSLEDMLADVDLNATERPANVNVLQPKVMTPGEIAEQKIEAQAKEDIAKATAVDPYENEYVLTQLLTLMESLEIKIQDRVNLDSMWRELNILVEKDKKKNISIARCYPMKNRTPDVLPFDANRVELPTTKDDYINASHIKNLPKHSPKFIATQAPTSKTVYDFWTMVWQESVEIMVCLLSELDFTYWPKDRKEPFKSEPNLEVTLQSTKSEPGQPFTERIFTLMNKTSNTSRVVIHLQLVKNTQSPQVILTLRSLIIIQFLKSSIIKCPQLFQH